MKTLVVSPHTRYFLWQTEFSYYTFKKYNNRNREGNRDDYLCLLIDGNHQKEGKEAEDYEPIFSNQTVLPFHDYFGEKEKHLTPTASPINIATAIKQWLDTTDYEGTIQIIDPDCIFTRSFSENIKIVADEHYCFVDDIYDQWHLKVKDKNGLTAKWIEKKYCLSNPHLCRGGFVPIIIHSTSLRKIIDSWIEFNLKLLADESLRKDQIWWANMYAFDFACAEAGIHQIPRAMATVPGLLNHQDDEVLGHVIHYSVYPHGTFNKKTFMKDFQYHGSAFIKHLPDFNNATRAFKKEFIDFVQHFRLIGNIF